jgi:hypothetical protein
MVIELAYLNDSLGVLDTEASFYTGLSWRRRSTCRVLRRKKMMTTLVRIHGPKTTTANPASRIMAAPLRKGREERPGRDQA